MENFTPRQIFTKISNYKNFDVKFKLQHDVQCKFNKLGIKCWKWIQKLTVVCNCLLISWKSGDQTCLKRRTEESQMLWTAIQLRERIFLRKRKYDISHCDDLLCFLSCVQDAELRLQKLISKRSFKVPIMSVFLWWKGDVEGLYPELAKSIFGKNEFFHPVATYRL